MMKVPTSRLREVLPQGLDAKKTEDFIIEVHNSETVNGHKRVGIDIYFTGVGLVDLATIKEMLAIAESSRP